eukprot:CAMPEP_0182920570 /NCGR_PEP_ID=MMETSP0105_2-20130417/3563_1 /TAXON_ID=81532 ORGANISM="Acanthoeca-like sp., Strain 10tr" /NCGR_SAMPLE_ID=MMETSP0105_2 /ASSEMBLY_ACC=CAM_ASM_000205 /LENGTH=108 /DNA_ID=CAMNT_0025057987 /DNA_START=43 /DNA_END=369 /DNA_ORIENTATION=-
MPCAIGYLRVRIPRLAWASSPTYESLCPSPTIIGAWRGRPITDGKTARGASSPAKPALHIPEPLSITRAATSSSAIARGRWRGGSAVASTGVVRASPLTGGSLMDEGT